MQITMTKAMLGVILFNLFASMCAGQELPSERVIGKLDVVATFYGPMPTCFKQRSNFCELPKVDRRCG